MGRELLAVVWFLLVGGVFWGTYSGVALPVASLQAAYAAFLLVVIAMAVLQRGQQPKTQIAEEGKDNRVD